MAKVKRKKMVRAGVNIQHCTGFLSYVPLRPPVQVAGKSLSRSTLLSSRLPQVRTRTAVGPSMYLFQFFSPPVLPNPAKLLFRTFAQSMAPETSSSIPPLEGNRSVVLVTGASQETGGIVVRQLLPQARKILAQVDPGFQAESCEWASRPEVTLVRSTVRTTEGIEEIATAAREAGVGSVVFAASGDIEDCAVVDNAAVGRLAEALSPLLGGVPSGDALPLFDFNGAKGASTVAKFKQIEDFILNGHSKSELSLVSESGRSFARFAGNITSLCAGVFVQTRAVLGSNEAGADLSACDGLMLRIRGGGPSRRYEVSVRDDEVMDVAFQAAINVAGNDAWQTVRIPFSDFVPMRRGKPVYGDGIGNAIYAYTLNTGNVRSVGIAPSLIEDGIVKVANIREREGQFSLDMSSIGAYVAGPPRFVLISSAAVTRPFWNAERIAMDGAAASIVIVKLNPGNVLGNKLAGENSLRRSDISWSVVRRVGLNSALESGRVLRLGQGDVFSGTMSREDAVRGALAALRAPSAAFKTFELATTPGIMAGTGEEDVDDAAFAKLVPDFVDELYPEEATAL